MLGNTSLFLPVDLEVTATADGGRILRSRYPLGEYPQVLTHDLARWADEAPDRTFLAERAGPNQWRRVSYGEALRYVRRLAGALLAAGLGPDRPLTMLSGNSVAQGVLTLAAIHVGIPVVPVSPAYSLMSRDYGKLKHIVTLATPGMFYVEEMAPFEAALAAVASDRPVMTAEDVWAQADEEGSVSSEVDKAHAQVGPDTVAKILFTSGSTGNPKGVINTHRMLCSNQQSLVRSWPFIERRPPVLVDWLPWSHTFGGNHNFNMVLRNGGTLYIDGGKPTPGLIGMSVQNLREVSPTVYFNVPAGFDALLPHLENDADFARAFFANLDLIFYAAAALPQKTWDRLRAVSERTLGRVVPMTSGWGATETAPLATSSYFPVDMSGNIGVPVPGVEIKLALVNDKWEVRVRGPNVTPGYLKNPEATAAAFDEDGFYRTGDAVELCDPSTPAAGLMFGGRISENFKLSSGTWVNVGAVRTHFVNALSPLLLDVVIAGENRDELGVLAFPNLPACRQALGVDEKADVCADPRLHALIQQKAAPYNQQYPAGSTRITRLLLQRQPPDIDAGETTDKSYLNQRTILRRRASEVESLFAGGPDVIFLK